LRYHFPDTRTLCQIVCQEEDAAARQGAQTALNWLDGDQHLVIASQRDAANESQALLRASKRGISEVHPETLLRGTVKPEKRDGQPSHRRTLLDWLFGKRTDGAD